MLNRFFNPALVKCFIVLLLLASGCAKEKENPRILVFTKTTGFRHESISKGIAFFKKMGEHQHIIVDTTENASNFYEENLRRYNAVVFLNTTGDVLNAEQQNNFERYIQAGGGYVGVHAATDTEYDWPWYGKLAGAYFESHPSNPNVQKGTYNVVNTTHIATDSLPAKWERTDEFYSFKNINPELNILITLDEKTYQGGTNGDYHPASWYHEFDGGRAFYTAMGHTAETYDEPFFEKHLLGGLQWVLGEGNLNKVNYSKVSTKRMPSENRFTKVVLDEGLNEPTELALLPGNRVLFLERKGNIKMYDPKEGKSKIIATIPVSTKYKNKEGKEREAEDGLLGLAIDPNYKENNWIYLYYSEAGDVPRNILTRYELKGDELILDSKKIILEVKVQRQECCHTGGSIAFDANGNLFLSTGDNTNPFDTPYAPIDERSDRSPWDAQKSSGNTNDLRGKILRIHPEDDGTYSIPEGNLFPKGTDKTRPEIYVMGNRNPYRISVDQRTGFLYWGDVGPDAGKDSVARGPKGHDEIGQAQKAGNFGWPHFVGNNKAYRDYNFETKESGELFDVNGSINNSPNNTGLQKLPPAQNAFIWYPYSASNEFPLVGKGGRTAMAGPVYYEGDYKGADRKFSSYYDEKLFIYEWIRGWIMSVTLDKEGKYVSMEPFMPSYKFNNPSDMEFSKETGDLYMLEYGTAWFKENADARLIRIEYTEGNRKPIIQMASDNIRDAVPMAVNLTAKGTKDFDYDDITYSWTILSPDGKTLHTSADEEVKYTFDTPGVYKAALAVTDSHGAKAESTMELYAGNQPPKLSFDLPGSNSTFFFPKKKFNYEVKVSDKEDGELSKGIAPDDVAVTIDYFAEGFDKAAIALGHRDADAAVATSKGKKIMDGSDCKACHFTDKKSVGPSFVEVAKKYKGDIKAVDYLAKKIINGGGGVWGETAMAAHPQLSKPDVVDIVNYILTLSNIRDEIILPPRGSYTAKDTLAGSYILRASYTDKGANGMPAVAAEKTYILRSPILMASEAELVSNVQKYVVPKGPTVIIGSGKGSYAGFKNLDLSGISAIAFTASAAANYGQVGGKVEVRIDKPDGKKIGASDFIKPQEVNLDAKVDAKAQFVKLEQTSGLHDVYFVFESEAVSQPGQSLFVIVSATMIGK